MNIAAGIERMDGCGYVRVFVPMMELRRRGHNVTFCSKMANGLGTADDIPRGTPLATDLSGQVHELKPDVFYVQRIHSGTALESIRALQSRGTKIVYDLDDNFHAIPSHNSNSRDHGPGSEKTRVQDEFVRMCDLFTVSTPGMADEYARIRDGRPMAICPNALDTDLFAKYASTYDGAPKREGQIRIGWAGSGTHVGDLRMILPALCSIMDEFPQVQFVMVGADMRALFPERFYRRELQTNAVTIKRPFRNRVEFAGESYPKGDFTLRDLVSEKTAPLEFLDLVRQADFDIAIAPIESNTFNRSKSWIKALEYSMMSIPMVLSDFGPYRDFARGPYASAATVALLAGDKRSWVQSLTELVESASSRALLGTNARAQVARNHLIHSVGDAWESALRAITTEPAHRETVSA